MSTNLQTRTRVKLAPLSSRVDEKQIALLMCGLIASVFYLAVNIVVPMLAEGYSATSQTVSELSAIGAPTRVLWVVLMIPYSALVILFGSGIWLSAGKIRLLGAVGVLFIVHGAIGLFWPPMHLRGVETTLTDTLHIAFTVVTILIFALQMTFAAAALRGAFLVYSLLSLAVMVIFGVLTGIEAPGIPADLPTPMIGVWERISIGAYALWVSVLSIVLVRRTRVWSG